MTVSYHSLLKHNEQQVVDTRPASAYLAFSQHSQPIELNVHGAKSLPAELLYQSELSHGFRRVLPLKNLQELFVTKGIKISSPLIFYSHEGISASLGAVCGWDMGGGEVRVYEGGWREYSAHEVPDLRGHAQHSEDMLDPLKFIAERHRMMIEDGEEEEVRDELIHVERLKYFRRLEQKQRQAEERAKAKQAKKFDLFRDYGDSD